MSKYGSIPMIVDGLRFPSRKEGRRYMRLKIMERDGEISSLELQPKFYFTYKDKKIFLYKADFSYIKDGEKVIEDTKGFRTPIYKLKKKLIEAQHGIMIYES